MPHQCEFDLASLCVPHFHIWSTNSDVCSNTSLSNSQGYTASIMGIVDLYPTDLSTVFHIVFDSGVSLAISPRLDSIAGPITMFNDPKRFGRMAEGLQMKG